MKYGVLFAVCASGGYLLTSFCVHAYDITGTETWTTDKIFDENVNILPGGVLNIEPGVSVSFYDNGSGENALNCASGGTLNINGTGPNPVTLTSVETTPQPGDWRGCGYLGSTSSGFVNHCIVEYAKDGIWTRADISFTGLISRYNSQSGIETDVADITITDSEIVSNEESGIFLTDASNAVIRNSTVAQNGLHGVMVQSDCTADLGTDEVTDKGDNYLGPNSSYEVRNANTNVPVLAYGNTWDPYPPNTDGWVEYEETAVESASLGVIKAEFR